MKTKRCRTNSIAILLLVAALLTVACLPVFAVTEEEVQAQVDASGKEAVTGNVLIWFLCAVAFLKVSQKIDSFMGSIGVNVGHTGGSMLSEVLVVSRALSTAVGSAGHLFGGGKAGASGSTSGGRTGAASTSSFFQGGLAGMVSRAVNNSAVKTATENKSSTNTVQADAAREAVYAASHTGTNGPISAGGPSATPSGTSGGGINATPGTVSAPANAGSPAVQTVQSAGASVTQNVGGTAVTASSQMSVDAGGAPNAAGNIPVSAPDAISLNEAEDENDIHPIPSSDPGISIHTATVTTQEIFGAVPDNGPDVGEALQAGPASFPAQEAESVQTPPTVGDVITSSEHGTAPDTLSWQPGNPGATIHEASAPSAANVGTANQPVAIHTPVTTP